jgi:elongation factor Ts
VVTVDDIKNLRETTGFGVMECKKALADCGGDFDAARIMLKEKGLVKAADRGARSAKEGLVETYIHNAGRMGVMVEINCETDFVARNEQFQQFAHDIAMHIAAAAPAYISEDEIPEDLLSGLPQDEQDDFRKEKILLNQAYIKDVSMTVGDMLTEMIAKTGENMIIRRFARFALGEER